VKSRGSSSFVPLAMILFVLVLSTLLTGCARKNKSEDTVLRAYRLIDAQRTDEAIELLEQKLNEDPKNYDYKVVLASAYAHKGGFKVQKLVQAVSQIKGIGDLAAPKKHPEKGDSVTVRVDLAAEQLAFIFSQVNGFLSTYRSVPSITNEDAVYLVHAIYLYSELNERIKPEDSLYRAALEIILFKHVLAEDFIGNFVEPKDKLTSACKLNIASINDNIVKVGKLLIDIFSDLAASNPDTAEQMRKSAAQTGEVVTDLTLTTTSLVAFDEASNVFLKQAVIQNGFGKIIKCDGDSAP
jgi:tetratricopeptide (TPR) repeat protein